MYAAMLCEVVTALLIAAGLGVARTEPGVTPGPDRIELLIRQLGHERFAQRNAASEQLEAIGEPALGALRKAAASDSDPEITRRAGLAIQAISVRVTRRELKPLQGSWSLVSYETDGMKIKGEDRAHLFTFKDDQWSMQVGGQVIQAGVVRRIEGKDKHFEIDLLITEGGNVGATAFSIYAVEGNSLKYLNSGEPRPAKFGTKAGDGYNYLTFRRAQR